MNISSVLSSAVSYYNSNSSSSSSTLDTTSSSSSVDFSNMTISQIRDITDEMQASGKLTDEQQLGLLTWGLIDSVDPSGQLCVDPMGYSRSDTGTYNVADILNGIADFDSSMGNTQNAATFRSTAQVIEAYEDSLSGSAVNTAA